MNVAMNQDMNNKGGQANTNLGTVVDSGTHSVINIGLQDLAAINVKYLNSEAMNGRMNVGVNPGAGPITIGTYNSGGFDNVDTIGNGGNDVTISTINSNGEGTTTNIFLI